MNSIWSVFYVLGFLVPPAIVLASAVYVHRLARTSRPQQPSRWTPWKWVGVHLAVVLAVAALSMTLRGMLPLTFLTGPWFFSNSLFALAILLVPLGLHRAIRRQQRTIPESLPSVETESARAAVSLPDAYRRRSNRLAWFIGITGVLAPWIIGVAVKLVLQQMGRPTLPFSYFLDFRTVPFLLFSSLAQWSFPFVGLALIARFWILPHDVGCLPFEARLRLVWLAYLGGLACTVLIFTRVFWEFDAMYLMIPLGLFLVPGMLLTSGPGWILMRRHHRSA